MVIIIYKTSHKRWGAINYFVTYFTKNNKKTGQTTDKKVLWYQDYT